MWVLIVAVGAAVIAFMALSAWQGRLVSRALTSPDCEHCGLLLTPVGSTTTEEAAAYSVLACTGCARLVTTVNGARSLYAWCPTCSQLSVEVDARLSGPVILGTVPEVDVEEHCTTCGSSAQRHLPDDVRRPVGKVLPFRPSE